MANASISLPPLLQQHGINKDRINKAPAKILWRTDTENSQFSLGRTGNRKHTLARAHTHTHTYPRLLREQQTKAVNTAADDWADNSQSLSPTCSVAQWLLTALCSSLPWPCLPHSTNTCCLMLRLTQLQHPSSNSKVYTLPFVVNFSPSISFSVFSISYGAVWYIVSIECGVFKRLYSYRCIHNAAQKEVKTGLY